ncbi:hypothetical protein HW561_22540 [Rhodobacteraceae bacterium B1Z28]|uniref:Uncharacterized protein n=1 Tax=Ruegeria haliotis TaxID=2747601 RepID=A0ABX2PWZ2_9RHOB|nr:hypothetical protein [Ruegeria haliotis]NVO58563.1 hypothetical protein [Ruegeria haliotis]
MAFVTACTLAIGYCTFAVAQNQDNGKAPRLSVNVLQNLNPLQIAAYACTGGAGALARDNPLVGRNTLVLGEPVQNGNQQIVPMISLSGQKLTGTGVSLGADGKLTSFQFSCSLSHDLSQATDFSLTAIGHLANWSREDGSGANYKRTSDKGLKWYTQDLGDTVRLAHGRPETDNQDYFAQCRKGGGSFEWSIPYATEGFGPDAQVPVSVFAPPTKGEGLYAANSVFDDESAGYIAVATVPFTDPLLTWIAKADHLIYSVAQAEFALDLSGSATAVREFEKLCEG